MTTQSLALTKLLSIGCGCGFLEQLLALATSIVVEGLEVNSGWWESNYSTPPFLPLTYTTPGQVHSLPHDKASILSLTTALLFTNVLLQIWQALLFCYFNAMDYFEQYLAEYPGPCIILIGPVDGKRHCAPEPFHLKDRDDWTVQASHDIRSCGQDVAVVYVRRNKD